VNLKSLVQSLFQPAERKYASDGRTFSLINLPLPSSRFLRTDLTAQEAVAHELVFRCLQKISDALMDAQPSVEEKRRGKEWEAIDHPLIARLKKPNDEQGWAEFITSLAVDEQVWGRWYFEIIRSRSNGVVAFVPLDVRSVTEIGERGEAWGLSDFWDAGLATGRVIGYRITERTETRELLPENVVAFYLFDRRSPLAGLSPVRVALNAAGVDMSLNRYADTYLTKGGPAGLLRIKNKKLSPTDAQAIQERWYESYKAGGSREGRIAVLDEDGEFQAIGGHLGEIGNDVLKQHAQAAICGALGVPAILAGAFVGLRWSNQRAGVMGAQQDLWANKITPTLARYRSIFDARVLSLYEDPALIGSRIRCNWDLSQVAALLEDVDLLAKRVRDDFNSGIISLNEARTARGYAPIEGGDDLLPDDPEDEDEDSEDEAENNQKDSKKKDHAPEIKAYDFNGLKLSRKPTEREAAIVATIAQAQEAALDGVQLELLDIKNHLIEQAATRIANLAKPELLTLSISAPRKKALAVTVRVAIALGRASVLTELGEKAQKDESETESEIIDRIVEHASAAIITAVSGRFVADLLRRLLRGEEKPDAINRTRAELDQGSVAYVEEIAQGAAYQAVADGRKIEARRRQREGDRYIYSSLLDVNTCGPCKADDLKEGASFDDVPQAPNPDCEGRWRCRCQIVIARD
jgi:HK97 family phage portal protein